MRNYNGLGVVEFTAEYRSSLMFHIRSCSGSSHPAEDVISSETSSFQEVSVRDVRNQLCSSKQSRGRVSWERKIAIQILNLLPVHEIQLTFYMENTYPRPSLLIPA